MHLVDNYNPTPEPSGVSFEPEKQTPNNQLKSWIPPLILVVAIILVSVLGSADKPSDDVKWLNRLADSGNSDAALQLGLDYRDGRMGLPQDPAAGLNWLKRSASEGNAFAEDELGKMYANGIGTSKNSTLAMRWWKNAMRDGDPNARLHLSEALIEAGKVRQGEALLR
ncbi:MAG: tetratricopeptide repeat protein [Acidiferrobacterales bacterium]|jgi:TPR repeat protein|nr:tetratricopeptide repeat protein [Acidiferrobacterales bacterium]